MLTLIDRIHKKLPQASESVLEQVWNILNVSSELSASANEGRDLDGELDPLLETLCERWEAASDEDEAQIEAMLVAEGING